MKFAAIDIGSNAVRLLLTKVLEIEEDNFFKKESLIRIPIRLGEDAFSDQFISKDKAERLLNTMIGFKHLMQAYQPIDYLACATEAMREAKNGDKIVDEIEKQSGIKLEIVEGKKEAEIIYSNHIEEKLDSEKSYLYVDVGGGSTELTIFSGKKTITTQSFKIGTVRLLQNQVTKERWDEMKKWIKSNSADLQPIVAIGSGGNINKIFRLSRVKEGKPISFKKIKEIYSTLIKFTYEERIRFLNLRPDRADVIIPAFEIFLAVMKWAKIKQILVPQIGLSDGLIHILYEKYKSEK